MKIEQITDKKLVSTILALEDKGLEKYILKPTGCTKAEYVQYLERKLPLGDVFRMWGVVENEKIKYYMAVFNCVEPPMSRSVMLFYQNFYGVRDENGDHLGTKAEEFVMEWARELGALVITTFTNKPRVMSLFGYEVEKGVVVFKKIEARGQRSEVRKQKQGE